LIFLGCSLTRSPESGLSHGARRGHGAPPQQDGPHHWRHRIHSETTCGENPAAHPPLIQNFRARTQISSSRFPLRLGRPSCPIQNFRTLRRRLHAAALAVPPRLQRDLGEEAVPPGARRRPDFCNRAGPLRDTCRHCGQCNALCYRLPPSRSIRYFSKKPFVACRCTWRGNQGEGADYASNNAQLL
ncbi:unnamed protein product, partial [Urochloa humidicola]